MENQNRQSKANQKLKAEGEHRSETEKAMGKLLKLSRILVRTHNVSDVLEQAVNSAVEIAPAADKGSLQLLEQDNQTLRTVAVSGAGNKILNVTPFQPNVGIAGHALANGKTINVPDVLEDDRFVKGALPLRFRSLLVAPLVIKDTVLGAVSLSSVQVNAFSQAHESLIQLIADQTAVALENARLFTGLNESQKALKGAYDTLELRVQERTAELTKSNRQLEGEIAERKRVAAEIRLRNRELALLNQVIASSTTGLEIETILDTVCRELVIAFNIPQADASLLNDNKTEATVIAEHIADDQASTYNQTINISQTPSFQQLLRYKAPLFVIDSDQNPPRIVSIQSQIQAEDTVLKLLLPITVKDDIVGCLGLTLPPKRQFSTEEVNVAWSVSDQVSGVLARVRFEEDRRQLEAQYHQAQKLETVGRLAAGVAHDFNNLLAVINGFAALIKAEVPAGSRHHEFVDMILDAGWSAADLISQLLAFSRKQIIEPQILNLNSSVIDTEKMLNRIIGGNIELITNVAPDLWPIKSDPVQMEQIIVNLAVNARDAMPNGGRLTIRTENITLNNEHAATRLGVAPDDYVLLSVSDTGRGIPQDVQEHIFEPFFTTKEVGKGTGLGLATVFGIVKQSGGNISLESEVGVGATFKICLPRVTEGTPIAAKSGDDTAMPTGAETILLVEDDHAMRRLTRLILQKQGYTLLEAAGGEAAIELAASHTGHIDLLLTDMIMPGMSGKTLSEQLLQISPDLKILFMSGYADDVIADHGILNPDIILLQKPFNPETLARKVRDAIDSATQRF